MRPRSGFGWCFACHPVPRVLKVSGACNPIVKPSCLYWRVVIVLLLGVGMSVSLSAAERQVLRGHVPETAAGLRAIGRLPATNRLDLAIGLPLRNRVALTNLLRELYDPASPSYHHYLTPERIRRTVRPDGAGLRRRSIAFARANGLTVTGTHPNRTLVDVSGPVADIERAFHFKLQVYQHPTESAHFLRTGCRAVFGSGCSALAVDGLDDFVLPRPMNLKEDLGGQRGRAQATPDATPQIRRVPARAAISWAGISGPRLRSRCGAGPARDRPWGCLNWTVTFQRHHGIRKAGGAAGRHVDKCAGGRTSAVARRQQHRGCAGH